MGLLTCLPVFFSGIVFVRSFRKSPAKDAALGANLLGALAGGLVVWVWKDEIEDYLDSRAVAVRTRAADGIHVVGEAAGGVFDRAAVPLRRAEEMLDSASVASSP